ncbi:MAG: hypothetical protein GEV28_18525 [Actinophytocola sp.]|nr:hypothetical protein [Actinophytocola sp.]
MKIVATYRAGPGEYRPSVDRGRRTQPRETRTEHTMSKRTSKRASRRKKSANHGKRPNGS